MGLLLLFSLASLWIPSFSSDVDENIEGLSSNFETTEEKNMALEEISAELVQLFPVKSQERKFTTIEVTKKDLKYDLQPIILGGSGSGEPSDDEENNLNQIVCLNAQNTSFYRRTLKSPELVMWILVKSSSKLSYANKRFFETGWRMNIQIRFRQTSKFELVVSSQSENQYLIYNGVRVDELPDVVYARLGAKIDPHSTAVVRHLSLLGVLTLNPFEGIAKSRDKSYSLQLLASHQLPIPKTMLTELQPLTSRKIRSIEESFRYPFIVKKARGTQGKGVVLVSDQRHLKDLVDVIDHSVSYLVQEYIEPSRGKDIRVFVVGGRAVGAMMRIAKSGYKSNFHQGGFAKPVKMSYDLEWLAVEAAKTLELDIAGVDILLDESTYRICEVNASPGFEAFEMATGIKVPENILKFVKLRLGVWKVTTTRKSGVQIPIMATHIEIVNEHLNSIQKVKMKTENRTTEVDADEKSEGGEPENEVAVVKLDRPVL